MEQKENIDAKLVWMTLQLGQLQKRQFEMRKEMEVMRTFMSITKGELVNLRSDVNWLRKPKTDALMDNTHNGQHTVLACVSKIKNRSITCPSLTKPSTSPKQSSKSSMSLVTLKTSS
jgi:hypothetical protein